MPLRMYFVRNLECENTNGVGKSQTKAKQNPPATDPPVSETLNFLPSRSQQGLSPCLAPGPASARSPSAEPRAMGRPGTRSGPGGILYISQDLNNSPTRAHTPDNTTRGTAREETGSAATARGSGALGRERIPLVYYRRGEARFSQIPASQRGFALLAVRRRAVPSRARPCEETTSDSDMDETIDVGSENNYSGQSNSSVIRSNSPTTTSQIMARKKRRGIIEKRRRDRINNSLSELRRLVPTAFEKQGSAKLEKAEILQMTVDHLKMLQATGGKGYFDAHSLAMDFMSIGFRECLTEVARYLTSVEGLDTSDPLRVRLVSHLSTCASQREAAAMTSSMAHHHHPLHPHHWAAAFHHLPAALLQPNGLHAADAAPCRLSSDVPPHGSALLTATFAHADAALRVPSAGSIAPCVPPLSTSLLSLAAAAAVAAATAITPPLAVSAAASPQQAGTGGGTKPYRPWGTEVGAF
ncbi:hypothetical protein Nmel_004428 [Mimus melanotis]